MKKNEELWAMFTYIGKGRWKNESVEWTNDELATLYYCLYRTLDVTSDIDIRHDIVFLMEKLFCETDNINLKDEI